MAEQRPNGPHSNNALGFKVDPRFTDLRPIGIGGNGQVFSAVDSECDKAVAIKKVSFLDRRSCKYTLREIRIMRRLEHENIVTVYEVLGPSGFSLDSDHPMNINEISSLYIVHELLDTDLKQIMQTQRLGDDHIELFIYQLLRGLKYIHSANVIHRDIKPANILINAEDLVLKVADFGLARVMDVDYSHKGFLTDGVGTSWYRAPELILSPRDYMKAIDMWSVGCVFAEMLTGQPLYPGHQEMDQISRIIDSVPLSDNDWNVVTQILPDSVMQKHTRAPKTPLKHKVSCNDDQVLDLLEKLLTYNPGDRMTAEEALAHPYLQCYSSPEDEPVAAQRFHIEYEVDDLSPRSTRRHIHQEISHSVETFGQRNSHTSSINNGEITNSLTIESLAELDRMDSNLNDDRASNKVKQYEYEINCGNNFVSLNSVSPEPKSDLPKNSYINKDMSELSIKVDIPGLGSKEYSQLSPKEQLELVSNEKVDDVGDSGEFGNSSMEMRLHPQNNNVREKDRLNAERKGETYQDRNDWNDSYSNKKETLNRIYDDLESAKFQEERRQREKRNKNNSLTSNNAERRDFDSLYRLPTEHLSHRRHPPREKQRKHNNHSAKHNCTSVRKREKKNERLRLEQERERCLGAVGGAPEEGSHSNNTYSTVAEDCHWQHRSPAEREHSSSSDEQHH